MKALVIKNILDKIQRIKEKESDLHTILFGNSSID
jgi:hypothetical protein